MLNMFVLSAFIHFLMILSLYYSPGWVTDDFWGQFSFTERETLTYTFVRKDKGSYLRLKYDSKHKVSL